MRVKSKKGIIGIVTERDIVGRAVGRGSTIHPKFAPKTPISAVDATFRPAGIFGAEGGI